MTTQGSKKLAFEGIREINGTKYLISSNSEYLDRKAISAAMESPDMYWAHSISEESLKVMLNNSFCLGLYLPNTDGGGGSIEQSAGRQIGLARLITDHVTFAWLTDVYVHPEFRRKGLGKWIVEVLDELFAGMPDLRRAMLIAEMDQMGPQYEKSMNCKIWENGRAVIMQRPGPASGTLGTKDH